MVRNHSGRDPEKELPLTNKQMIDRMAARDEHFRGMLNGIDPSAALGLLPPFDTPPQPNPAAAATPQAEPASPPPQQPDAEVESDRGAETQSPPPASQPPPPASAKRSGLRMRTTKETSPETRGDDEDDDDEQIVRSRRTSVTAGRSAPRAPVAASGGDRGRGNFGAHFSAMWSMSEELSVLRLYQDNPTVGKNGCLTNAEITTAHKNWLENETSESHTRSINAVRMHLKIMLEKNPNKSIDDLIRDIEAERAQMTAEGSSEQETPPRTTRRRRARQESPSDRYFDGGSDNEPAPKRRMSAKKEGNERTPSPTRKRKGYQNKDSDDSSDGEPASKRLKFTKEERDQMQLRPTPQLMRESDNTEEEPASKD